MGRRLTPECAAPANLRKHLLAAIRVAQEDQDNLVEAHWDGSTSTTGLEPFGTARLCGRCLIDSPRVFCVATGNGPKRVLQRGLTLTVVTTKNPSDIDWADVAARARAELGDEPVVRFSDHLRKIVMATPGPLYRRGADGSGFRAAPGPVPRTTTGP